MRQIDALLTQLDAKKRDHFEFVAKELQELQDCGKLSEVVFFLFSLKNSFWLLSVKFYEWKTFEKKKKVMKLFMCATLVSKFAIKFN